MSLAGYSRVPARRARVQKRWGVQHRTHIRPGVSDKGAWPVFVGGIRIPATSVAAEATVAACCIGDRTGQHKKEDQGCSARRAIACTIAFTLASHRVHSLTSADIQTGGQEGKATSTVAVLTYCEGVRQPPG